jgi:hypothetical protein
LSLTLGLIFVIFFWWFFSKGTLSQLKKAPSVDTLYLLVTILIVAVWPAGYSQRLLFPVLPIVLFHLIEGVKAVREDVINLSTACQKVARPLWHVGVAVLLVGTLLIGIPEGSMALREKHQNNEALFLHMKQACNWIRSNTESNDVIASYVDPLVYLLAGRPSINVAFDSPGAFTKKDENVFTEDDILGAIKRHGVSHVLITSFYLEESNKFLNKKFSEIIKKYPDAFHKCFNENRVCTIYRVNPQYIEAICKAHERSNLACAGK